MGFNRLGSNVKDFLFEVVRGNTFLEFPVTLVGLNEGVGNGALETVWPHGDRYVFPTSAAVVDLVSDDAQDSGAGTGIRRLIVRGLDANYDSVSEVMFTNGTTIVTSTVEFFRINEMNVEVAGSALNAQGVITVSHGSNVLACIEPNSNITRQAVFTVPRGTTLWQLGSAFSPGKGDEMDVTVFAYNPVNFIPINTVSAFVFESTTVLENRVPKIFPELHDVEVVAISKAGGSARISVFLEFILTVDVT